MLIDTGAGINIVKESHANAIQESEEVSFLMGNDKHTTNRVTILRILEKTSIFHVPNDFPLIEDGLIELPFLNNYDYNITNKNITLDGKTISFQEFKTETEIHTTYLDGKHTPIYFYNNGKRIHHVSNGIIKYSKDIRLVAQFREIIRTKHIESALRDPVEKILKFYLDVFNLDTDSLPCTNLTHHNSEIRKTNQEVPNTRKTSNAK